ncbi:elongation factor P 5-aminopentanone reductase, partial [Bombilactobacillus bombi]|uniref:elongation factor P 5-aminopentanone reductase n=1 Tax=Bombilactobacillus bombi TaxID=1303590 RepID=UPI0015E61D3E
SGGIGRQIAADLAEAGWSLYLQVNKQVSAVQTLTQQWQAQYPQQDFLIIKADFTQAGCVNKIVKNIFSIDALIAAQGITDYQLFAQIPQSKFEQLLMVNVTTPLLLIQQLQEKLSRSHNSRIVLLGSVYGHSGSAMEVTYSMTKGALSAFAKAYAQEVASLGITVNVLAPGAVDTPMLDQVPSNSKEQLQEQIPVGRLAQGNDISYWIKVLLDPASQYVTGQTLYITGGWLE